MPLVTCTAQQQHMGPWDSPTLHTAVLRGLIGTSEMRGWELKIFPRLHHEAQKEAQA